MKARQVKWATLLTLAAGAAVAVAAETTLKIGDPAPALQNGKWMQGAPVKEFKEGKAYLVEFWATWCGPCRVSIPHLNEIHNKYQDKGLVVIGQDCWERDDDLVEPFIKKMGEKMTYRVALDDKQSNEKGKMAETWMAAAGRNGIPSAFLVNTKGVIAWIGHPMELKDSVIEAVLEDNFNVQNAADEYAREQKQQAELRPIQTALSRAMMKKDWDEANNQLAEMEKMLPEDKRGNLDMTRLNILFGKKDYPAAYKLVAKLADTYKDNATMQNELAWRIATDPAIEERDLGLAEKLATSANELTKGKEAGIIDTLARVRFMQGKKQDAIELQKKAVELAEDAQQKSLQKVLDSYQKGELPKAN